METHERRRSIDAQSYLTVVSKVTVAVNTTPEVVFNVSSVLRMGLYYKYMAYCTFAFAFRLLPRAPCIAVFETTAVSE